MIYQEKKSADSIDGIDYDNLWLKEGGKKRVPEIEDQKKRKYEQKYRR